MSGLRRKLDAVEDGIKQPKIQRVEEENEELPVVSVQTKYHHLKKKSLVSKGLTPDEYKFSFQKSKRSPKEGPIPKSRKQCRRKTLEGL
jgi:hypothetical protein